MGEVDDHELLGRFTRQGSEAAFAALVGRHVNLVHSVALRQTGDPHQAEEVTQAVFIILARKAARLSPRVVISGWLYQTARLTAANYLRGERRRAHREQEAHMQSQLNAPESEETWQQMAPVLDAAMGELGQTDRDALVLRYFEGRTQGEVGVKLGVTEDAAKMRVSRALEKLRQLLAKRGVALPGAAIAAAVGGHAVQAAPAALAATSTAMAVQGAFAAGSTIALVKTTIGTMSMMKLKLGAAALVVVAGISTPLAVQHGTIKELRAENASLAQQTKQLAELQAENERLAKMQASAEEVARLRGQESELLRLRGEVARLRQEKLESAKLTAENGRLRQALEEAAAAAMKAGGADPNQENDPVRIETIARLNTGKQVAVAFLMFANDNAEAFPQTLDQVKDYFPKDGKELASAQANFDVMSSGTLTNIAKPSQTVLLREKQARRGTDGKWVKVYVFADGHAEAMVAPTGDFDARERERGLVTASK